MHSPVLAPVHGMPSTAGRSGLPGMDAGMLGAGAAPQAPVAGSATIPGGHSATGIGAFGVDTARMATAGAAQPRRRIH